MYVERIQYIICNVKWIRLLYVCVALKNLKIIPGPLVGPWGTMIHMYIYISRLQNNIFLQVFDFIRMAFVCYKAKDLVKVISKY